MEGGGTESPNQPAGVGSVGHIRGSQFERVFRLTLSLTN